MEAYARSEEAVAAEDVLEAYKLGDKEAVRKAIDKHMIFRDLDNQVSRYSRYACWLNT